MPSMISYCCVAISTMWLGPELYFEDRLDLRARESPKIELVKPAGGGATSGVVIAAPSCIESATRYSVVGDRGRRLFRNQIF